MVKSMTGFGQAGRTVDGTNIQVDLKSVNHRYCEIIVRMPREWLCYEESIKKTIQQGVKRGRVDVFITMEHQSASANSIAIDWPMAEAYIEASERVKQRFQLAGPLALRDLMFIPELVSFGETRLEPSETVEVQLIQCVKEALGHLLDMREAEGSLLCMDISDRLQVLENVHKEVASLSPLAVQEYRDKLRVRIKDLLSDTAVFDETRFAMEIALMADRSDIDEELTRLQSHFSQCRKLLSDQEPVGRKLDFLIQEMNREVNTIGSKANHTELINKVVDMKAELEKIREQVQNIE